MWNQPTTISKKCRARGNVLLSGSECSLIGWVLRTRCMYLTWWANSHLHLQVSTRIALTLSRSPSLTDQRPWRTERVMVPQSTRVCWANGRERRALQAHDKWTRGGRGKAVLYHYYHCLTTITYHLSFTYLTYHNPLRNVEQKRCVLPASRCIDVPDSGCVPV